MKQGSPQPLHEVMNLTTTVDHMCFNHNDEIIAMSSSEKKSAVRLVCAIKLSQLINMCAYIRALLYFAMFVDAFTIRICFLKLAINED